MRACKTGITIVIRDHLRIPLYAKASCPPGVSVPLIAGLSEEPPEDRDLKEKGAKMCGSRGGRTALWTMSWSCLRLCPGYFKCVVVYARCKFRRLTGTRPEAGLLLELWTCRMILLRSTLDSFDGIRVLFHRIGCLPKKAVLYFRRKGRSVLPRAE